MNEQHHGNVLGGAIAETTQTADQLATIAATAAQTVAWVRVQRLAADQTRDQAAADAERAVLRSDHAAARLAWAPGLEPSFHTTASRSEAAAVWAAAQPWADRDPSARDAARRAVERPAILYPQLIAQYQQHLADGLDPVDAMAGATTVLGPVDVNGAPAARALAGDERGETQQDATIPDRCHRLGRRAHPGPPCRRSSRWRLGYRAWRAALLPAQAYPQPLQRTLGCDTATRSVRAGPVREVHRWRGR